MRQNTFTAPYDPYFDKYHSEFYKVLFKAGTSINQSHLNHLQTILQEQIATAGQHFFVNGSFVTGGNYSLIKSNIWLEIQSENNSSTQDINSLIPGSWIIESEDQEITLLAIDTTKVRDTDLDLVLVSTENTSFNFILDKVYILYNAEYPDYRLYTKLSKLTECICFDEGVLYINGYFLKTTKQYCAIRNRQSSVGFQLNQSIVSYYDDPSLFDNSLTDNSIKGSDRLQLSLKLVSIENPSRFILEKGSFFEFLRIENGEVIKDLTKTQYASAFANTIERRTYDESGNYTVIPFKLNITNYDSNNFTIEISPGKAYIFGYEYDSISKKTVLLPKYINNLSSQDFNLRYPAYSYFTSFTLTYPVELTQEVTIKLFDSVNEQIGTATLCYIDKADLKYRLHFSYFELNPNKQLSDVFELKTVSNQVIAQVVEVQPLSVNSRIVSLASSSKVESIDSCAIKIQKVFTSVQNNTILFANQETPPEDSLNYIAFNNNNSIVTIDSITINNKEVLLNSVDQVNTVLVFGVDYLQTSTPVIETESVLVPFNTTIFINSMVKKIISCYNNQQDITSYFELSYTDNSQAISNSVLTYIGTEELTGNVLIKYEKEVITNSAIRLSNNKLDFRSLPGVSLPVIEPNSIITLSVQNYQSRFDKLILTRDKQFELITGTPHATNPQIPKDRLDAMSLYTLFIPGNCSNPDEIGIKYIENKRYTMRDIGKLEKRIENLEYYTALTLLEKNTADQDYVDGNGFTRFKNGFLVDNFKTYKGVDFNSIDCSFSLDTSLGELRPSFSMTNVALNSSEYTTDLLLCPYTEVTLIDQNQSSSTINLNPYEVFTWEGKVSLSPSTDVWVDTTQKPDITLDHTGEYDVYASLKEKGFTSEWGSWDSRILELTSADLAGSEQSNFADVDLPSEKKLWTPYIDPNSSAELTAKYQLWVDSNFTQGFFQSPDGYVDGNPAILLDFKGKKEQNDARLVNFGESEILTNSLGTSVRDVAFSPYIRPQNITYNAIGLKPNTVFFVYFSDIDVTNLCSQVTSDSEGKLTGILSIPANRFNVGKHEVKFVDTQSANTSQVSSFATSYFTANGLQQTVQETFISTREPEITSSAVSFTTVSAVYDTSVLTAQKTITVTLVGSGSVELFEAGGSTPILIGVNNGSVYYNGEVGKNYKLVVTELTEELVDVTGCDYFDNTQSRGPRQILFYFEADRNITVTFKPIVTISVQLVLVDYITAFTDSETTPYYKVTLQQFPDYVDKISYLQYRKTTSTYNFPSTIIFPYSSNGVSSDIFQIRHGDYLKVEFFTDSTRNFTDVPYLEAEDNKIRLDLSNERTFLQKTFTQADIDAVSNKEAIQLIELSFDEYKELYIATRSSSTDRFVGRISVFDDYQSYDPHPSNEFSFNAETDPNYKVCKVLKELTRHDPYEYLFVENIFSQDPPNCDVYHLNANQTLDKLQSDIVINKLGFPIYHLTYNNNLKSLFIDFKEGSLVVDPADVETGIIDKHILSKVEIIIPAEFKKALSDGNEAAFSDLLYIENIDVIEILKTDYNFPYLIDKTARKVDICNLVFDVPFNSLISIEIKMKEEHPWNLKIVSSSRNNFRTPELANALGSLNKRFCYPLEERKSLIKIDDVIYHFDLTLQDVVNVVCTPLSAPSVDLVPFNLVIGFNQFVDQQFLINDIDISKIFEDYNNCPFKFRTRKKFLGSSSFLEKLESINYNNELTEWDVYGTGSEPTSAASTLLGSNNKELIHLILYVTKDSLLKFTVPDNPTERMQVYPAIIEEVTINNYGKKFINSQYRTVWGYSRDVIEKDNGYNTPIPTYFYNWTIIKEGNTYDIFKVPEDTDVIREIPPRTYDQIKNSVDTDLREIGFVFYLYPPGYIFKNRIYPPSAKLVYAAPNGGVETGQQLYDWWRTGKLDATMIFPPLVVTPTPTVILSGGSTSTTSTISSTTNATQQGHIYYFPFVDLEGKDNKFSKVRYDYGGYKLVPDKIDRFSKDGYYTEVFTELVSYLTRLSKLNKPINYQQVYMQGSDYYIKTWYINTLSQLVEPTLIYLPTKTNLQGWKVCLTDPLAQSFFIDAETYPEGLFVSSVDLFFKTKSSISPVTLELRPSVNGYPSSKEVIPFSRVMLTPTDIAISDDASRASTFKFDCPIYLKPGEYHFVVISQSTDYTAWTGRLGEFILGDEAKGRITKNPYAGNLFKSSNNTAWLPDPDADFTFKINRCKFTTGSTEYTFSSNDYKSTSWVNTPFNITTLKPAFSTLIPENTSIRNSRVTLSYPTSTSTKTYTIPLGMNFDLDAVHQLSDTKFNNSKVLTHSVEFYTAKDTVSPILDLKKSSYVLVNNLINSLETSEQLESELRSFGGSALARYITKPMRLNLEIPANKLRLEFAANTPQGTQVRAYYRIFNSINELAELSVTDKNWVSLGTFNKLPKNSDTFIDFSVETPTPLPYSGIDNLHSFDTCQIKLVLDSTNPALIPRVKDFRLIALSE